MLRLSSLHHRAALRRLRREEVLIRTWPHDGIPPDFFLLVSTSADTVAIQLLFSAVKWFQTSRIVWCRAIRYSTIYPVPLSDGPSCMMEQVDTSLPLVFGTCGHCFEQDELALVREWWPLYVLIAHDILKS